MLEWNDRCRLEALGVFLAGLLDVVQTGEVLGEGVHFSPREVLLPEVVEVVEPEYPVVFGLGSRIV